MAVADAAPTVRNLRGTSLPVPGLPVPTAAARKTAAPIRKHVATSLRKREDCSFNRPRWWACAVTPCPTTTATEPRGLPYHAAGRIIGTALDAPSRIVASAPRAMTMSEPKVTEALYRIADA